MHRGDLVDFRQFPELAVSTVGVRRRQLRAGACSWRGPGGRSRFGATALRSGTATWPALRTNSIAHLGYAKADFGRADVAIAHYRQVLEVHSAFPALDLFYDAEAYKNLGVVLADRRQFAEAVAYYQKALAINANDAEAYYNMGVALAACGRTDEAIANYQRAVEIKSDYAAAHNNLGLALASRERLDEAMVQFQQALEIDPSYADAHNNLGNVLVNRGRIDQATAHYRTALELKPDYAEAHFNLGLALTDQGRTEEATEHYQQALILATQQNKPALVEKLKAQLRPFQNNKIQ